MSIDVFAPAYDSAAAALLGANHACATTYVGLTSCLNNSGSMAGNDATSTDFAAAYDDAAQATMDALVDLVDATGNLSVLTATSIENHRRANAAAVYTAPPLLLENCQIPAGAGEVDVEPYDVPGSEGGDGGDLPALLDLVVDHVQGVFWPSADVATLRVTAQGWRYAVGGLDGVAATCQTAIEHLAGQSSPEIPLAIGAIRELITSATELADSCHSLAAACDEFADEVEHHRDLIKDILRALAVEAGFTAGAGFALSMVTLGGSAAGASAFAAIRAAKCGARIIAVLSKLRTAVRVGAASRLATVGARVRKVSPVLKRLANRAGRGGKRPSRLPKPRRGNPVPRGAKPGWTSRAADNGKGTVWQKPGATGNADSLRKMQPTSRYPHGYVRFYNQHGQPIGLNGRPGTQPETHIPLRPDGTYDMPEGW